MKFLRKNGLKLVLDVIMTIILVLLYNKRVLGMAFHEIAGLGICGLFIVHKLLNWKWLKAVTVGLFSRRTPARQKLYWALDLLLFGCFVYILISGIMISKILFPTSGGGMGFKTGHYAVAALALALVGVHVGLHFGWIGQRIGFLKKLPKALKRGLCVVLSVAVLVFGSLQLTSTSFLNWIGNLPSMFTETQAPSGREGFPNSSTGGMPSQTATDTSTAANAATGAGSSGEISESSSETSAADCAAVTDTAAQISSMPTFGGEHGSGNGAGPKEQGEATSVAGVLLSFISILLAFATVTGWIDAGLRQFRRRRLLRAAAQNPAAES
ncbi:MAG TPA: DUF4405 domain-containing protein [Candidatus Limiplasma sp.]|nr:DUF4405 domain-containing protein [Candidatus Limiplasma sp.]HPS82293.1 DUF4405 domain-containing protein [Candidatus Limiplasma sp.]